MKLRLPIRKSLDGLLSRYRLPGGRLEQHSHDALELDFVVRGTATILVDRVQVPLAPRSLLWLFPGQEHLVVKHSDDFEMWIGCFRPRLLKRSCTTEETHALRSTRVREIHCRQLSPPAARRLYQLLAEVSAYEESSTYNAGLAHLLLHAWMQYQQADEPDLKIL